MFSARKFHKKENEPPIRLLDDLFRKTKTVPCVYWLPLTSEQVSAFTVFLCTMCRLLLFSFHNLVWKSEMFIACAYRCVDVM